MDSSILRIPHAELENPKYLNGNEIRLTGFGIDVNRQAGLVQAERKLAASFTTYEQNPGKMTFTTASGLLPAGIAVYVQRGPNGVHLETR